jgi:hypothetical protein
MIQSATRVTHFVDGSGVVSPGNDSLLVRPISDLRMDIAKGLVSGVKVVHKFGRNDALGGSVEDVWTRGGLYVWLTAADTLTLVSTDANDTAAGTGVRTVAIEGLAADFTEQSETIALDGLTPVTTSNSYIRMNRAFAATQGTYQTSTTAGGPGGDITIDRSGGGAEGELLAAVGGISWDYNQTHVARYTVPAGKTACLTRLELNNESDKKVDFVFWQRQGADQITAPFTAKRVVLEFDGVSGPLPQEHNPPIWFPEKTDLWWSARLTSGAAAKVSATFELVVTDIPT